MTRRLRWFVLLFAVACTLAVTLGLVVLTTRGTGVSVRSNSVLVIDVEGDLPEQDQRSPIALAFEGSAPVLHDVTRALDRAATDSRISAVWLRCRGVDAGWGKLEELRDAIGRFRHSGKKVVASLEWGSARDYFVACAADRVLLVPSGLLEVSGLMSDVAFYRGTLDKLGILADMEHIGDYKNAADVYTRDSMSVTHREATNAILDSLSKQFVEGIAASRSLPQETVAGLVERGLFSARDALEAKLVDALAYEDEVVAELEHEAGPEFPRIGPARYGAASGLGTGPRIAVVYASGTIVTGDSGNGALGGSMIGSEDFGRILRDLRDDAGIRAVVLRVDSPGGSAIASDVIWREAERLKEKKPVVASMSDVAASGGYYIAMGADAIVAQPGTLTGSIGVISGKFNLRGFYDWIGMKREQIKRGRNADIFSDYSSFSDDQRRLLLAEMRGFYGDFVRKAGEGRGRSPEEIEPLARGRVWTGEQARERGLVDALGGLDRAIALAREKAGIAPSASVRVEVHPRPLSLWEALRRGNSPDSRLAAALPPPVRSLAARWQAAARLAGEAVLAWDPDLQPAAPRP